MKQLAFLHFRPLLLVCTIALFAWCVFNTAMAEPTLLQQAYILALMLCMVGVVAFASGRPSFALAVSGGLFFLLKFISETKLQYLHAPLMPEDFVYFARTSLLETLERYPDLLKVAIVVCIAVPLLCLLIWRFDYRLFNRLRGWQGPTARVIGVVSMVTLSWLCLIPGGPFAPIYRVGVWQTLSGKAHLTSFFGTMHDLLPRLPARSNDEVAEKNWASTARGLPAATDAPNQPPDIIQVLEESTFDPARFTGCTIPQCHVQMFRPDQYTRAYGLLRTHTFGGGTWVSEFASFSGMPQDIFGQAGMYAPYVLAPRLRDSLPKVLDKLGYLTIGVYPADGAFINARNAYKAYGFEKFYDISDLGLRMWHASDAQMFAAAKKIYDENKKAGQPIFMMILTLEQHGPHDKRPLKELPAPFNQGLLPNLPPKQELNLSTYLARLRDSDEAMAQLEHDFLHRAQPTVILQFGDHLPSFGGLIRDMPQNLSAALQPYKDVLTYFMLKSNFSGPALPDHPLLDIAYLPTMILRAAGLPEDPYFSALARLESSCKGLYDDCHDKPLLASYYAWIFDRLDVLGSL